MIIGRIHDGVYYRPGDPGFDGPRDDRPVKGIPTIRTDKPHESTSAAVHVDQVETFNRECVTGVHYNEKGNLISTSKHARQREAMRRGKRFN